MGNLKDIDAITTAIDAAAESVESREVLRKTIEAFNGAEGVAKELYNNAMALSLGHANRLKVILAVFQAMLDSKDVGGIGLDDPEVLKATLKQQLSEEQ